MPEETLDPEEIKDTSAEAPQAAEDQAGPSEATEDRDSPPEPARPDSAAGEAAGATEEPAAAPEAAAEPEEAAAEQPPQPDYQVDVEDAGTLRKKVTVTVPGEMIDAKRNEMFGELMTTAQVPGFRKGRAPRRLIEKRFGREVGEDVRNALIGESLGASLEKAELTVLGEPDLDLDAVELPEKGDMSYSFEVEVAPDFELPELKGIPVRKPVLEVTEQRIDEALERLRLSQAAYEPTEGAAEAQDVVSATATISIEGTEELTETLSLRVAPGQIEGLPLVDLGEKLAGKKAGETAALTTRGADVHPNEAWRGKDITIDLTIHEVRKRVLPEVNDEYARDAGYDSLADLREALAERMKGRVQIESQRAARQQVRQYLLDEAAFDLPEGVVRRHTARVLQRRYIELLSRGIPREQIDERLTEIQAMATEEARRDLRLSLVLQKIADQREIQVGDEEVNAQVALMASQYGRRPERLRQELAGDGTLDELAVAVREEKTLDNLLEDAEVTAVTAESLAEQEAEDAKRRAKQAEAEQPEQPAADEPAKAEQEHPPQDKEEKQPAGEPSTESPGADEPEEKAEE